MSEDGSDGSIDIGWQLQESDERNKRKRDEAEAEESESSPVAAPVAASLPRPRQSLQEIQHRMQMQIQEQHQQRALAVPPRPLEYYDDEFAQDMYMGQLRTQELRERPPRPRTTPSPKEHARSTSASPVQRSASPAMRKAAKEAAKQVQKKKKENEKIAKKEEDDRLAKKNNDKKIAKKAEGVRLAKLISAMICGHDHIAHKHKIVCGQEQSPKDGEIYNVAMTMTVRKDQPNEEVLDLSKFTSKDVRALALKCGVRGGGNMTIFTARMEIARSIQMGTMYTDLSIANPGSDAAAVRINTLIKLLNICFHADNFTAFVALNDSKGRKDYEEQPLSEQGVSGNP
ncbi:unknown protein [Seminavis robusta]|uniref:Uncharacterized protein n=1 Tax=Seminavis robusta TaxID=568900 RepID=A0A9N8HT17_9STRA|nr:unknown protein [Seminavis robusta]|eukprot:Sro1224_g254020.1 n/a (343) ;mRNA; f:23447-24475